MPGGTRWRLSKLSLQYTSTLQFPVTPTRRGSTSVTDVPARSQQNIQAVGVAVLGCNVNRRSAVVLALVDVPARSGKFIGQVGEPKRLSYNISYTLAK